MNPADEMAWLSLNTALQLLGQFRQHDSVGVGADHHDALFPERCEDGPGEAFGGPRRVFLEPGLNVPSPGGFQRRRGGTRVNGSATAGWSRCGPDGVVSGRLALTASCGAGT